MVNIFGERLKKLRISNKLSQEGVASLADVNRMTVVKWEKGTSEPALSTARYLAFCFDVEFEYLVGEDEFTLYLFLTAERFAKAKKSLGERKNEDVEFAQWIVYWNDLIESCYNSGLYPPKEEWEEINERVGWSEECDKIRLNFPDDYNKQIIDYIIKADFNGLLGDFKLLPCPIQYLLPQKYADKPDLYKHLLGF